MGIKCEHGLDLDECPVCCKHGFPRDKCSMCFNENQIHVDAYFQARADKAGELGLRSLTRETPEPYLSGYRAGWNDAMMSMLEHIKREEK